MGSCDLSDDEKQLFKCTIDGDFNEVKRLVNDVKIGINGRDEQDMTLLQHAAFKGHYEICKLLLDCGADVNDNNGKYGYTALSLAAISNHCNVVTLLLDYGANVSTINSNKRTAAEMAAFVGNHRAANIINNYVSKDIIDYFTEIHGLEKEPRLPKYLCSPVHKLLTLPSIHPIRIVLFLQSNSAILQNLKKVIDVLNIISEKQLKEMSNDRLSLKSHHIAFILLSANDFILAQRKKSLEQESLPDQKILDTLMRSWLKGSEDADISLTLEKFLRKSISAYPFQNCVIYQQIVATISSTELGNEPNALSVLSNAILGQHMYAQEGCATCGDQPGSVKTCSGCKQVQYCDKTCQKLHWFIHKNSCKK